MVAFNGRPCISFVVSSLASRLRSLDTLHLFSIYVSKNMKTPEEHYTMKVK